MAEEAGAPKKPRGRLHRHKRNPHHTRPSPEVPRDLLSPAGRRPLTGGAGKVSYSSPLLSPEKKQTGAGQFGRPNKRLVVEGNSQRKEKKNLSRFSY